MTFTRIARTGAFAAAAAVSALLTLAGPAHAGSIEDAAAVHMLYEKAVNAGDLDGVVALFAPEGALLPPAGGYFEGADAISAALKQNRPGKIDIVTTNVATAGDVVIDIGTFAFVPADGSRPLNGEYVAILRDSGAGQRIFRLMQFPPRMAPEQ